jgi:hypothetical protein
MALNNLANRLAETGDRQGALGPAHEAVRHYTQLAQANPAAYLPDLATALNNLARHLADTVDESASLQAYTHAATALSGTHPDAARAIEYERYAFQLERSEPTRVADLRGLVRMADGKSAGQPGDVTLRARRTLRDYAHRSETDRDLLKHTWQQETGSTAPDWLSLSEETLNLVVDWVSTPSWADSQAFWSRHHETLSSEEASIALEELALVWPIAARHLELRKVVLSEGRDAVFQQLIVRDRLQDWLQCETWDASKSFLQENGELLLDESAEALLAHTEPFTSAIAVHVTLLRIARTEGIDTAFNCVQDRSALQAHVLRALSARDAQALAGAAAIESSVFDDQASFAAHYQAAVLLADEPDFVDVDALAEAAAEADPETRNRLTAEFASLVANSPDGRHTPHWLRLIQALTQTRP